MTSKDKIIQEMNSFNDKTKDRVALEVIGEHVLDLIDKQGESNIRIDEDKSLIGAMKAMSDYARSKNSSCITDKEGFRVVCEYFGITQKKSIISADVDSFF